MAKSYMVCHECGAEMYIDDKDYNFKGNYDVYWNCPDCQTSCIEEVRFSRPHRQIWYSENDGVKDFIFYPSSKEVEHG